MPLEDYHTTPEPPMQYAEPYESMRKDAKWCFSHPVPSFVHRSPLRIIHLQVRILLIALMLLLL